MANHDLVGLIEASGKSKTFLASKLGITVQTFRLKCEGRFEFKLGEAVILAKELGITKFSEFCEIFLK